MGGDKRCEGGLCTRKERAYQGGRKGEGGKRKKREGKEARMGGDKRHGRVGQFDPPWKPACVPPLPHTARKGNDLRMRSSTRTPPQVQAQPAQPGQQSLSPPIPRLYVTPPPSPPLSPSRSGWGGGWARPRRTFERKKEKCGTKGLGVGEENELHGKEGNGEEGEGGRGRGEKEESGYHPL